MIQLPLPAPQDAHDDVAPALTLRAARPDDAPAVRRLAQLDSSRPPTGRVLLAVVGSEPVAALDVDTGSVVADPFRPTADVVAVLRQAAA